MLYWMQQSQRAACNHALEYAASRANELELPLLVAFGLTDNYPEANARHYSFMLEGLRDVGVSREKRGIGFVLQRGDPSDVATKAGKRASLIVCDRGYLHPQKAWRTRVADAAKCSVMQVEADVVVPVEAASGIREFAARTLRPKLTRLWPEYLRELTPVPVKKKSVRLAQSDLNWRDPAAVLRKLAVTIPFPQSRSTSAAARLRQRRCFVTSAVT